MAQPRLEMHEVRANGFILMSNGLMHCCRQAWCGFCLSKMWCGNILHEVKKERNKSAQHLQKLDETVDYIVLLRRLPSSPSTWFGSHKLEAFTIECIMVWMASLHASNESELKGALLVPLNLQLLPLSTNCTERHTNVSLGILSVVS